MCQIHSFIDYLRANMTKENFATLTKTIAIAVATVISGGVAVMTLSGKVAPWPGRFCSLLDPSYAKNNIPIIASVSEHQPTAWSSFYFDLQVQYDSNKSKNDGSIICASKSTVFPNVTYYLSLIHI